MNFSKRLIFTLFTFFIPGLAFSQNAELIDGKILSKKQLTEDYSVLYSSLINYHPAPFLYTSETDFKEYFQRQESLLPDSLSEREFYIIAKSLVTMVKCGHTDLSVSDSWNNAIANKSLLLPFEVYCVDEKVFVKNTSEDEVKELEINNEIVSINNESVADILHQMYAIQSRDGNTLSYVREAVARNFRIYYLYLYGYQNEFLIEYVSSSGEIKTTTVKSLTKRLKEIPRPALLNSFKIIYSNDWSVFATDSINNLAYLQIKSFLNRKDFKEYYKETFLHLQKHPNLQLIIDVRNNSGGYYGNGNTLLSYLTPSKFEFNFQKPKGKTEKNKYAKLDKWNKLTKFAFSMKPGKHKVKGQRMETFTFKPKKPYYSGKVNVITNGITFSQAALFASHLKAYGAIFYGTETGGTESGTNAMLNYKVILPNSGFKASIAHYQVISNSSKGEFGFGVKPNFEIKPDYTITEDNILLEVMNIISANK